MNTTELNVVVVINIYLIIGIMITLSRYDTLVIEMKKKIEEDPFNFAGLSIEQLNYLIKYTPLLTVLVWPLFIIGFIQGIIKGINNVFNR